MSDPDGQHIGAYDSAIAKLILSEAADILRALGYAGKHAVLIGGMVPGLLVPILDPGIEPHVGTADIDICLSLALVEGDTGVYERIEKVMKTLGFKATDDSFRWRRQGEAPLTVEFFCPAGEERPAGKLFRPRAEENPVAKKNLGGTLSALALEAGALLTEDVELVKAEVDLPRGKGRIAVEIRVTGPVAFVVAKTYALLGRDKPKDAYDIVWLVESWTGGPAAAARDFSERSVYQDPAVTEALVNLGKAFEDPNAVGARSYATFVATRVDEEAALARRAVGAVQEFLQALGTMSRANDDEG